MNTPFQRTLFVFILAFGASIFCCNTSAEAQSKIKPDEKVKVLYLGDWRDGLVIEVKKKQALVEYKFVSMKRDVFDRKDIRKLNEVDAIDFSRSWTSTAGTRIEAALKRVDGQDAVLIKTDMEELVVPLDKLSTKDQNYVKKMVKGNEAAVNAGVKPAVIPELPKVLDFGKPSGSMSMFSKDTGSFGPLGRMPSYLKEFKQNGMGFDMARDEQDLVSVIPVGGPDELVLMTARESNWKGRAQFQSQVYWVSLSQQKMINSVAIAPEDYAIDYDPRNKFLLTFNHKDTFDDNDDPDHWTIWRMEHGDSKAEPLVRWEVKTGTFEKSKAYGRIINDRIVLTKTDRHTYAAWDLIDRKCIYWLKSQSFFDVPAVLSPDRNHLIFPEDGQVTVVDAANGKTVFSASVPDRHCSGANINADGTKLAAISERNIYVWDLNSSTTEPTVYPAPLMASPFSSRVEWIGNDHILGESHQERILYRLSLKLPVWSYRMDVKNYFLNRDPRKNLVVDGMFFYVAEPNGPFSKSIAVGAVKLPGPSVEETTANIDPATLLILKAGVPVGIQMTGVTDESKVESWLDEKIKENQWVRDDNAEIQMHVEMGVGEQQTIQYQEMGTINGSTTSVSFRPHFSKIALKKEDVIIWQSGTSTGAPPIIHGSNVQSRVSSYQKPNFQFFKNVKIDAEIIDPKYSRGFGVSKLGLRGIEVVSTTPPGREADPMAAAAKAEEDEKKANQENNKGQENGSNNETGVGGFPRRGEGR